MLDFELSIYQWAFAVKRTAVAALAEKPPFGFAYQYALPPDFLRLVEIDHPRMSRPDAYALEADRILTDIPAPLKLRYISRVLTTIKYPPYFVQAFTCRLAYELCERLKQDPARKHTLLSEYTFIIRDAKRANAIQLPVQALPLTDLEVAQYGD